MQQRLEDILLYGDCPNLEQSTAGGTVFWQTIAQKTGWRLQVNPVTGLARILDASDIRKAWGSEEAMREKFRRLTREEFLEPGDIIGITRKKAIGLYDHYAVYVGDGQVVHYAAEGGDFGKNISIHLAGITEFLKSDARYFVLYFPVSGGNPVKIQSATSFLVTDSLLENVTAFRKAGSGTVYSAEETVQRALSRIGEEEYHLLKNNCEHFAIWCKTGKADSVQVKRAMALLMGRGTFCNA